MEIVNSELRIGKLGRFSARRGICTILHIWKDENKPAPLALRACHLLTATCSANCASCALCILWLN